MKCLAPTGGTSAAAGSAIVIKTCDITDQSQTWTNNTSSGSTWTWGPDSTKCLDLQDGNLVLYNNKTGASTWSSGAANQNLYISKLAAPASVYSQCSAAGMPFSAAASTNSALSPGTGGQGTGPYTATLQNDGNLVVFDSAKKPLWVSHTDGRPVTALTMQNDGNLVIYNGTNLVWATNTTGK
ncbi:uncharacterized protein BJ171DRAFT_593294 [Polychytrium aggregatum]|uniref:uncharacterized protein n=1 Tax=Polychytrium aggregatum TaxID=110093 RepID=UPI0022FEA308|nr:uncharacterized protein BJ171DRAFT_593294 [Polychytrium aggregatum]KAI9188502.1 hypothetical protein BJ171DRAFT_593294 [Polychytrium aggregatum]